MLDDPASLRIARNRIKELTVFPDALAKGAALAESLSIPMRYFKKFTRIIIAGMGGSAIAGDFLRDWLDYLPIQIHRDYGLPAYVGENSLVIVVSYSGNTQEALSAFLTAYERRLPVITISSGGKLEEYAHHLGVTHLKLPNTFDTQGSFPYLLMGTAVLLRKLALASFKDDELREAVDVSRQIASENDPRIPTRSNPAKREAKTLKGHLIAVYSHNTIRSVAHRLKNYLNENAKAPARWDVFPELSHNEATSWDGPLAKRFTALLLRADSENDEAKKRIEATKKIVLGSARKIVEWRARGAGRLAQLLSLAYFGDFVTCYLGVLGRRDPTETRLQAKMKKLMVNVVYDDKVERLSKFDKPEGIL